MKTWIPIPFALIVPIPLLGAAPIVAGEDTVPRSGVVALWPDGAPGAKGDEPADRPVLRIYLPPKGTAATDAGVIVCPGGGYSVVAIDHEGVQVARRLNDRGVAAFVLTYRRKPAYLPADALIDAQRAVRYVRHHAGSFGIAPDRIGMLGFSAGGHLTSAVGTDFDAGNPSAADPIDRESSRPDFLVLCYPVISAELRNTSTYISTDSKVTPETPPTFLFHTSEDTGVSAEHSLRFYQALRRHGVPAELHVFAHGPHGTGLAPGDPATGAWPDLLHRWMRNSGLLTASPRLAVSGAIRIDGQPLHRGWITLIPTGPDAEKRPVASAYITHRQDGQFTIDAAHGPTAGPHRVEIRRVATALEDEPSVEDERLWTGLACDVSPSGPNVFAFELDTALSTKQTNTP